MGLPRFGGGGEGDQYDHGRGNNIPTQPSSPRTPRRSKSPLSLRQSRLSSATVQSSNSDKSGNFKVGSLVKVAIAKRKIKSPIAESEEAIRGTTKDYRENPPRSATRQSSTGLGLVPRFREQYKNMRTFHYTDGALEEERLTSRVVKQAKENYAELDDADEAYESPWHAMAEWGGRHRRDHGPMVSKQTPSEKTIDGQQEKFQRIIRKTLISSHGDVLDESQRYSILDRGDDMLSELPGPVEINENMRDASSVGNDGMSTGMSSIDLGRPSGITDFGEGSPQQDSRKVRRSTALSSMYDDTQYHPVADTRKYKFFFENEVGVNKFVSTFIRPMPSPHKSIETVADVARFVADFIIYCPLKTPNEYPTHIMSPAVTLHWRRGTCFDMATLLCSILKGQGYDAYCVSGMAVERITREGLSEIICPYHIEFTKHDRVEETLLVVDNEESGEKRREKNESDSEESHVSVKTDYLECESKGELFNDVPVSESYPFDHLRHHANRLSGKKDQKKIERGKRSSVKRRVSTASIVAGVSPELGEIGRISKENEAWSLKHYNHELHSWVLVRTNTLTEDDYFVEPTSGWVVHLERAHRLYESVHTIWNDKNYWVNVQSYWPDDPEVLSGLDSSYFDMSDSQRYLNFLPSVDRPADANLDLQGYSEIVPFAPQGKLEMEKFMLMRSGTSFLLRPRMLSYHRVLVERHAAYGHPDGITLQLSFHHGEPNDIYQVRQIFEFRADKLHKRVLDIENGELHEYFHVGRKDGVKEIHICQGERDEIVFYPERGAGGLMRRIDVHKRQVIEFYEGRNDKLIQSISHFDRHAPPIDESDFDSLKFDTSSVYDYYMAMKYVLPSTILRKEDTFTVTEQEDPIAAGVFSIRPPTNEKQPLKVASRVFCWSSNDSKISTMEVVFERPEGSLIGPVATYGEGKWSMSAGIVLDTETESRLKEISTDAEKDWALDSMRKRKHINSILEKRFSEETSIHKLKGEVMALKDATANVKEVSKNRDFKKMLFKGVVPMDGESGTHDTPDDEREMEEQARQTRVMAELKLIVNPKVGIGNKVRAETATPRTVVFSDGRLVDERPATVGGRRGTQSTKQLSFSQRYTRPSRQQGSLGTLFGDPSPSRPDSRAATESTGLGTGNNTRTGYIKDPATRMRLVRSQTPGQQKYEFKERPMRTMHYPVIHLNLGGRKTPLSTIGMPLYVPKRTTPETLASMMSKKKKDRPRTTPGRSRRRVGWET